MTSPDQTTPRFFSLWSINGDLDRDRLVAQLHEFAAAGLDGVVFHPRYYTNVPRYLSEAYFAIVSEVIIAARDLGLAFWLYDEDGWPSGTVGGLLLEQHPHERQRWIDRVAGAVDGALCTWRDDTGEWSVVERFGEGVDYLSPTLAGTFLRMTHENYRDGLSADAWAHVAAVFSDEPELGLGHAYASLSAEGALPWTADLVDQYQRRYGADLIEALPRLFSGGDDEIDRQRFWELASDLLVERFLAPIDAWCTAHGKIFTAHIKGEEHPYFQVPMVGSLSTVLRPLGMPGIDALGRLPVRELYPRQAATVSRQFGTGRTMAEAFGGAGWGAGPTDLERYLLWLGRCGVTDFVLHLSQYRLSSQAIMDWPPSHPLHVTWREAYATVLDRVRGQLQRSSPLRERTLVIVPQRAIMRAFRPAELALTNIHDAHTYPASTAGLLNDQVLALTDRLDAAGVDYDVIDERTADEHLRREGSRITVGREQYASALITASALLGEDTQEMLHHIPEPLIENAPPAVLPEAVEVGSTELDWRFTSIPVNRVVLEPASPTRGVWEITIDLTHLQPIPVTVHVADPSTLIGSSPVPPAGEGSTLLTVLEGGSVHTVTFRTSAPGAPVVWAEGEFRVVSDSDWVDGPSPRVVSTAGAFSLYPTAPLDGERDLIRHGYAFAANPVPVTTTIGTSASAARIRLEGIEADAVQVVVDGTDHGWFWADDGDWTLPVPIPPGSHTLELRLVPNSLNVFGPHHHVAGDPLVVSPAQFVGTRNFADTDDAPENTATTAWNLRRLALPSRIVFIR